MHFQLLQNKFLSLTRIVNKFFRKAHRRGLVYGTLAVMMRNMIGVFSNLSNTLIAVYITYDLKNDPSNIPVYNIL